MTGLRVPEGFEQAAATEISDSGTIIGTGHDGTDFKPFVWATPSSEARLLPLPDGFPRGEPVDISDDGRLIVGYCWVRATNRYAGTRWERGDDGEYSVTEIGTDDGVILIGLNNAGDAVGLRGVPAGPSRGILVRAGTTTPINLSSQLAVGTRVEITNARDINGSGQIAGMGIPRGSQQEQGVILTSSAPDLRADWQRATKRRVHRAGVSFWTLGGRVRVRNPGDGDSGRFRVRIFLSKDRVVGGGDLELARRSYLSLGKGATDLFTWDFALDPGTPDPRGKYLYALVDGPNRVLETNEGNNVAFYGGRVQ